LAKVVLIGLDAAVPTLVKKYIAEGVLRNIDKLAQEGTWAEGIPVFPTHTASNWNTVSTGAWPKTHGVTDMVVHLPGKPLTEIRSGFYSDLCQAEHIWETAEREGKRSLLMKFIGSWPPTIKEGIQVEGFGAPGGPGSRPWGSSPLSIANSSCFSTKPLENATVVRMSMADLQSWTGLPAELSSQTVSSPQLFPLETTIRIGSITGGVNYNVLLFDSRGGAGEYDTTLLTRTKQLKRNEGDGDNNSNSSDHAIILKKGDFSDWQIEEFHINGNPVKAAFRLKLVDIGGKNNNNDSKLADGPGGSVKFKLFVSQIFPIEGWAFPNPIAKELLDKFGPFLESISHFPYVFGWTDEETYLADAAYQAEWMGNATKHLMSKYPWDLYMTQWHGIDNTQHAFLRFDKSVLTPSEAEICDKVVLKTYEIADKLVGNIVTGTASYLRSNQAKKQVNGQDEEIYTLVLSDHGHVMGKRRFFINSYLYEKGFIKLKEDPTTRKLTIDWEKTQAYAQGMVHVYVNLQGREPHGSVKPGSEYEKVVESLIDTLYDIKDPKTAQRPIVLALSNKDAEFLGLSGQRVGDVVVAANAVYALDNRVRIKEPLFEDLKVGFRDASIHGSQLPSLDLGENGTIKSIFIAHGPRIKKGYVRKKPINMVDVAPTVAHILGISAPKDSEGAIMHDIFE
jgi:predicted AlkP superfamily phosphohydrolase/phosphomutase